MKMLITLFALTGFCVGLMSCGGETSTESIIVGHYLTTLERMQSISIFIEESCLYDDKYMAASAVRPEDKNLYSFPEFYLHVDPNSKLYTIYMNFIHSPSTYEDPFRRDTNFTYLCDGQYFILISAGPDGLIDGETLKTIFSEESLAFRLERGDVNSRLLLKTYDPTNGLISGGDIFYFGPYPGRDEITPDATR